MNWPHLGQLLCCVFLFINLGYSQVLVVGQKSQDDQDEGLFFRQTGTVLFLDQNEIEQFNDASLNDVLQRYGSLYLTNQGPQSSLFLRGANSSHVTVLIDGVQVNDPSSPNRAFDFSKISLSSLKSIEILQGPQSIIHGGDALAGVISLTTKDQGTKNRASLALGRYQTLNSSVTVGARFAALKSQTTIDLLDSKGFSLAKTAKSSLATADPRQRLNLTQQLSTDTLKFSLSLLQDKFSIDRNSSSGYTDDPNDYSRDQQASLSLNYTKALTQNFKQNYLLGARQQKRETIQIKDDFHSQEKKDTFRSSLIDVKLDHSLFLGKHSSQFGVDFYLEKSKFPQKRQTQTKALYLQQRYDHNHFFVSAGARVDSVVTQSFSVGMTPYENAILKYHYATGFKEPSLFQLFDTNFGNPSLSPERSTHHELSWLHKGFFQLAVFETRTKNLISFDPQSFVSINIGGSRVRGIEWQSTLFNSLAHQISMDITALEAIELETKKKLLRRPERKWGLKWSADWSAQWNSFIHLRWLSSRLEFDGTQLGAFSQVDALAKYRLDQDTQLSVKMENVFKAQNETAAGFNTGGRIWTLGFQRNF